MQKEIGIAQAKDRLSELVERVAQGEEFVITRRGEVLARLIPPSDQVQRVKRAEALQAVLDAREGARLGDVSLHELIEAGRR